MSGQKDIMELRRALFGSREDEAATFYATVTAVDEATRTCTVEAEDIPYDDVLLHAVADAEKKGFCFVPAVGSTVLVSRIGGSNELYVSMFSEVEKVLLTIGDKVTATLDAEKLEYQNDRVTLTATADKVEINADEIVLNGGEHKGLVKIEELQKNLDSIKQFVEGMHAALPAAFAAVGAAMAANGALGKTAYDGAMAGKVIMLEEMENDKVKH